MIYVEDQHPFSHDYMLNSLTTQTHDCYMYACMYIGPKIGPPSVLDSFVSASSVCCLYDILRLLNAQPRCILCTNHTV